MLNIPKWIAVAFCMLAAGTAPAQTHQGAYEAKITSSYVGWPVPGEKFTFLSNTFTLNLSFDVNDLDHKVSFSASVPSNQLSGFGFVAESCDLKPSMTCAHGSLYTNKYNPSLSIDGEYWGLDEILWLNLEFTPQWLADPSSPLNAKGQFHFSYWMYPYDFGQAELIGGDVHFTIGAGVPEPASWAMMIGGFALVGGALRRRRATVSKISFG